MTEFTLRIDIPALDKLVTFLEGLVEAEAPLQPMEERETPQPPEAAAPLAGAPETPQPAEAKPEPAPMPEPETPQPPEAAAPLAGAPRPEPETPVYTLDQVQRAAAQLRDQGKLKAVTDMFPEFAIKKLSDLKADALQAFAGRLIGLGAKM